MWYIEEREVCVCGSMPICECECEFYILLCNVWGCFLFLVWVFIYLLCHAVLSHTCSTHMFTCQGKLLTGQDFKICMGLGGHLSSQLVDALGFSEISLSSKYISTWSEVRQHFNHKLGEILLNEIASKLNTLGTSKWKYFL